MEENKGFEFGGSLLDVDIVMLCVLLHAYHKAFFHKWPASRPSVYAYEV